MSFFDWLADWRKPDDADYKGLVPGNPMEQDFLHEVTLRAIGMLDRGQQAVIAHTQTLHLWLLASLLTLNGGAAIALGTSDIFTPAQISGPVAAYLTGCVLAITTGLVSSLGAAPVNRMIGDAMEHWVYDVKLGAVRPETQIATQRFARLGRRLSTIAGCIGLLSLGSFCFGSYSLVNQPPPAADRAKTLPTELPQATQQPKEIVMNNSDRTIKTETPQGGPRSPGVKPSETNPAPAKPAPQPDEKPKS